MTKAENSPKTGEILLYKDKDGKTEIEVKFENESVWLNQKQMAMLFDKDYKTISEHIRNVYKERELKEEGTIWKFQTVQKEGDRTVKRNVVFYNLDVIISVGYRVKSLRGTQFRIRATQRLKDYLIKGFSINSKKITDTQLNNLEEVVLLIKKNIEHKGLSHQETKGLLDVITHYTYSWILLQKYDEESLSIPILNNKLKSELTYHEAIHAVQEMKNKFLPDKNVSEMFGIERNNEFRLILQSIYQSFDSQDLYPSVEEKAAYLLYFLVKNHPFADGNKKIGAFLFLRFLTKNNCLYNFDGSKKIDDTTVVAITLLIATSDKDNKEMIIRLILNLLSKE